MILKAQEVHFELHNSAQDRYEVDMTNDGHTSSTGAQGTLLWVCHLGACRSSYQLRICVVLFLVGLVSSPRGNGDMGLLYCIKVRYKALAFVYFIPYRSVEVYC